MAIHLKEGDIIKKLKDVLVVYSQRKMEHRFARQLKRAETYFWDSVLEGAWSKKFKEHLEGLRSKYQVRVGFEVWLIEKDIPKDQPPARQRRTNV